MSDLRALMIACGERALKKLEDAGACNSACASAGTAYDCSNKTENSMSIELLKEVHDGFYVMPNVQGEAHAPRNEL